MRLIALLDEKLPDDDAQVSPCR